MSFTDTSWLQEVETIICCPLQMNSTHLLINAMYIIFFEKNAMYIVSIVYTQRILSDNCRNNCTLQASAKKSLFYG